MLRSFDEMDELPEELRRQLAESTDIRQLRPLRKMTSKDGMTVKVQGTFEDPIGGNGPALETVLIKYPVSRVNEGRRTVCLSTQVGCAVGCPFCATGEMGFKRQLSAGEIVAQVMHFHREKPVDNVVFMGMGEPFLNYENVWKAVETLNSPSGLAFGARRLTLSTSGIIPGIRRLADERILVNLAVSLHAPKDGLRCQLVPVNKKYPLADLMAACDEYTRKTGRRICYEYVLLAGVNDSHQLAHQLGRLLKGRPAHVNLIPVNPTTGDFQRPEMSQVVAFQNILHGFGVRTTIRAEKGVEISAACGQLTGGKSSASSMADTL
jgi:23S rRNA (adenine2503-C2)-methyltransferase